MLFSQLRSHSLMDRTLACGAGNVGSIPTGSTIHNLEYNTTEYYYIDI